MINYYCKFKTKQLGILLVIIGIFIPLILFPFITVSPSSMVEYAILSKVGIHYNLNLKDYEIVIIGGKYNSNNKKNIAIPDGRVALPYKYPVAFGILLSFFGVTCIFLGKNIRKSVQQRGIETEKQPINIVDKSQHGGQEEFTFPERAEAAPTSFRILMEAHKNRLENEYPQLRRLPGWQNFVMASTVAGCFSLALRLHFDVPEGDRSPTELKMRDQLKSQFPSSEQLYEDCSRFVTQSFINIPRPERAKYTFILIAMWVIANITEENELENEELIVGQLAYAYQNETVGYWKPENAE